MYIEKRDRHLKNWLQMMCSKQDKKGIDGECQKLEDDPSFSCRVCRYASISRCW